MIDLISRQDGKIKVAKGQDPYNVIGNYIREHLTVIEDMIAVIRINDSITNELFLVDWDEEGYFVWHHDWWEGEENVELIDFYPVSDSERLPEPEEKVNATLITPNPYGLCSECGYLIDIRDGFNFCPKCGADIRGGQNETN